MIQNRFAPLDLLLPSLLESEAAEGAAVADALATGTFIAELAESDAELAVFSSPLSFAFDDKAAFEEVTAAAPESRR